MLVMHGCQIDKPDTSVLHACRVRPLTDLSSRYADRVRNGGVKETMYLSDVPTLGEMYVDFRYWHRVLRSDLDAARARGGCVASMTVDGRLSLQTHLFRFHTRRLPDEAAPTDPDEV